MPFQLVGLNHQTAPIAIREKLSFAADSLRDALRGLHHAGIQESVILSTCNRTEFIVYDAKASLDQLHQRLFSWLQERPGQQIDATTLLPCLYRHDDDDAIRHTFRVACGLDSMILGEPQILGQLKTAHDAANEVGTVGTMMGRWLDASYSIAKKVRHETQLGAQPVSVAYTAVSLATQIFARLDTKQALLIGAGETIELVAKHLIEKGVQHLIIANRTLANAEILARSLPAQHISCIQLDSLNDYLPTADLIITSTAATHTVVDKSMMKTSLKARKHKPVFIADLAVPRDVAEEVTELEDVYLYTVDDLQQVIAENMQSRQAAAKEGEHLVTQAVVEFSAWRRSLNSVEVIRQLRENTHQDRDDILERAQRMLAAGKPADDVLAFLANTLTNKFLHTPSSALRDAGANDNTELLDAAQQLFNLRDTL